MAARAARLLRAGSSRLVAGGSALLGGGWMACEAMRPSVERKAEGGGSHAKDSRSGGSKKRAAPAAHELEQPAVAGELDVPESGITCTVHFASNKRSSSAAQARRRRVIGFGDKRYIF